MICLCVFLLAASKLLLEWPRPCVAWLMDRDICPASSDERTKMSQDYIKMPERRQPGLQLQGRWKVSWVCADRDELARGAQVLIATDGDDVDGRGAGVHALYGRVTPGQSCPRSNQPNHRRQQPETRKHARVVSAAAPRLRHLRRAPDRFRPTADDALAFLLCMPYVYFHQSRRIFACTVSL